MGTASRRSPETPHRDSTLALVGTRPSGRAADHVPGGPAEAVNLHQADCELPETGWGRLHLTRTTPEVGKRYTDSGELHDDKGLKHRPGSSTYTQVWRAARAFALALEQARSPLAGRPYDLRHAAASLWLNAGVPAPTVARRAGHCVDVLLRVYANCIDGDEEIANQRISGVLS